MRGLGTRGLRIRLLVIVLLGVLIPGDATMATETQDVAASADSAKVARRITSVWDDTDIVHVIRGEVMTKDEVKACFSRVPVQIRRQIDGQASTVASGHTDATGAYNITAPEESGPYRAVAPRVKRNSGKVDDIVCKRAVVAGNLIGTD